MKQVCGLCHQPLDGLIGTCAGHPISGEVGLALKEIDLYEFDQRFFNDVDSDLVDQVQKAPRGSRK